MGHRCVQSSTWEAPSRDTRDSAPLGGSRSGPNLPQTMAHQCGPSRKMRKLSWVEVHSSICDVVFLVQQPQWHFLRHTFWGPKCTSILFFPRASSFRHTCGLLLSQATTKEHCTSIGSARNAKPKTKMLKAPQQRHFPQASGRTPATKVHLLVELPLSSSVLAFWGARMTLQSSSELPVSSSKGRV